ncbi:TPA: hypothetical protein I7230_22475 [Vibrio vulnificus]|nr:hypothetical protein [Vibrio vulnificus]
MSQTGGFCLCLKSIGFIIRGWLGGFIGLVANKAIKSDSKRLAFAALNFSQPSVTAYGDVMFSHVKSVGCIFSLLSQLSNFGLVGKLTSVFAVFWTPIRGREKFRELPH